MFGEKKKIFSHRLPLFRERGNKKEVITMKSPETKFQLRELQNQRVREKSLARRAKIESLKQKIRNLEKEVSYLEQLERKAQEVSNLGASSPTSSSLRSEDPIQFLKSQAFSLDS